MALLERAQILADQGIFKGPWDSFVRILGLMAPENSEQLMAPENSK